MQSDRLDYLPSAARTAAPAALADQQNDTHDGLRVVVDVTAIGVAPSITVFIEALDPVSGKYYTLLASAAITAVGTTVLQLFPGAPVTANLSANTVLAGVWRIRVTHANADSITYSIGVERLEVMAH